MRVIFLFFIPYIDIYITVHRNGVFGILLPKKMEFRLTNLAFIKKIARIICILALCMPIKTIVVLVHCMSRLIHCYWE